VKRPRTIPGDDLGVLFFFVWYPGIRIEGYLREYNGEEVIKYYFQVMLHAKGKHEGGKGFI
jgi:hypothetical protein